MRDVIKMAVCALAITGAATAFGETAKAGSCLSKAIALKASQQVTLVNEYDPDFKEFYDSGVCYYKVTLRKGQAYTIWISGGAAEDMSFSVDVDWRLETYPFAWFDYQDYPNGVKAAYMYSDSWDEDDPSSFTYYVQISGEIGQKTTLGYTTGISTFSQLGEEGNPKPITVENTQKTEANSLIEGAFFFITRLEAGRKYMFRTTGGSAANKLSMDIDPMGDFSQEVIPTYSNDLNNTSWYVYPDITQDYIVCVYGSDTSAQSFKLKFMSYPSRLPGAHTSTQLTAAKNYTATGVSPGRKVGDVAYYDNVIDEELFRIKLAANEKWAFETSGAISNIQMVVYDSSGKELRSNSTMGTYDKDGKVTKDCRVVISSTAADWYYVGVCNPSLGYWDPRPVDRSTTVRAYPTKNLDPADAFDPADDAYTGAELIAAYPASAAASIPDVGYSSGTHQFNANDWYDWFCFAGRSGVTYALKSTLASNVDTGLKLAAKVFKVVDGSLVKVSDVVGSISPDGTDEALKALTFTADANSMYYVRVSVADGFGLDYPEYKVHAIAYMADGKTNLGLVQGKTKGADSTWYFTDDSTGLYSNGAMVAVPVGVARNVKFSPVSGYATPAKTSVTPVAWGGEAADIKVVTGIYNDTYDPGDNNEAGFATITPTTTNAKAKRTLWAEDPGDWFRFKAEAGYCYNFYLTDTTQDGVGDAVFLIKYYTDTTNIVQGVTEYRKKVFAPREKGKYNLRVYHRAAPRQDTAYRLYYQAVNVGVVKFATTTPKVSESADYVDVVVQRTASMGAVRVNFATEALTAKPGKEYYPTNGVLAWADGDMSDKTIRVRLIPDLEEEWQEQLYFKIRLWGMSEDALAEDEYPVAIEADTAKVKIKEMSAKDSGTIKVVDGAEPTVAGNKISLKIARTGGSVGKVAVKVKTQPGTALADRDYVYVNKTLVWNDGDSAPKAFEITTKDSRAASNLSFNIKMTVQNTGAYANYDIPVIAETKTYLTLTPAYAAGTVVLSSPLSRSVAPGDTLKAVFSRTGSGAGRIAVKVKTQDASTVNGITAFFVKDLTYAKEVLVWENGDMSDKTFEVPTTAVSGYGDSKTFRVKLSVMTTGEYAGCQTPFVPESKIIMTIANRNAPAGDGVQTVASGYDAYGNAISGGRTNELAQGVRTSISLGMGGGQKAASCSLLAGELPPGLKFDSSKFVISGAPTAPGYYSALFQARNGNAAGAGMWLDFHVSEIGTAAGSFTAAVREEGGALANNYPRVGRISSLTIGQNGTISATVKIAGVKYKFSAGSFNSLAEGEEAGSSTKTYLSSINSISTIDSATYTNKMEMTVVSGDLEDGDVLGNVAGSVKFTLNVLSGGEVREVIYKGDLVRDNSASEEWLKAVSKYVGYYTVSLVPNEVTPADGLPCGNGYITLTLDETGTAKYAGLLADGTAVSGSSKIALRGGLIAADSALIPIGLYTSPWSFGGMLKLDWAEDVTSGYVATAVDSRFNLEWNKDGAGSSYDGQGFSIEIRPTGGWYNTLVNLQTYYLDSDFYVQAQSVYGLPGRMLPSGYTYTADTMPHDVNAELYRSSLVPDTRVLVTKEGSALYDLARSVNPWKVKTSFVPATGLLSGTFKAWSDGATTQTQFATLNHYGVLLMNRDANTPLDADVWTAGFYLLPVNANWTFSLPFNIKAVKVDRDWTETEVPVVQ